ncbi:MAG: peptidylprolyl isomerase [Saprospiraceae bacterium]|nr:peptidylprolyl isomerase [Saprospiraceae bacterium]MDW8484149.1 peptidylprolyl isomerase [Saprospiraceae bacterium]
MTSLFRLTFFACAAIGFGNCHSSDADAREGDVLLAKVYNKSLYRSELKDIVPPGTSPDDSILLTRAYIQRWVRDQLLMYEAERNIPKDLNIDKLVRDYRASLVRFNFEEQIIAEQLDSTLSESELRDFYENNKDQFQLESTILKCQLIVIPSNAPQNEFNRLWYSKNPADENRLRILCKQWAKEALLDAEQWHRLEEISALLPRGTLTSENVAPRREGALSDGDFRYYYRVLEVVRGKQTAPFEYVREQAKAILLHKRKQDLIERWKEDLYQKELRRQNIWINH